MRPRPNARVATTRPSRRIASEVTSAPEAQHAGIEHAGLREQPTQRVCARHDRTATARGLERAHRGAGEHERSDADVTPHFDEAATLTDEAREVTTVQRE